MTSNDDNTKDRLLRDYDTVLKESAILTSFGGILFGFLLNIFVRGTLDETLVKYYLYDYLMMHSL